MGRFKHVAVLMGGWSSERDVSLRSGAACATALERRGYRVTRIDVKRDIATVLDTRGIAVRAGHHCAKPAHQRFGVQSSTRMSSYLYTTPAEIDALVDGLEYTRQYFKLS